MIRGEAMVRFAETRELDKVANYAYQLNAVPQHKCKVFPSDYASIMRQFSKMLDHPEDQLLLAEVDGSIKGLLALMVEKENKYLEAIGGVFAQADYYTIANEFFNYIRSAFLGYQLGCCLSCGKRTGDNVYGINWCQTDRL